LSTDHHSDEPPPVTAAGAPHLLYVAWGYPPARGAGRYRALATSNAFAAAGWDVTVLTVEKSAFENLTGTDPELEKSIDPRVTVVRAPFDSSRGESDISLWSRFHVYSPLLWNFLKAKQTTLIFPETNYGAWKPSLLKAASRIHADKPVSLVIGTANPNVDFTPGHFLKKRFGVPYVMDYRDTWHLNVYTGKRVGSPWSASARIERKMLRSASEAWFVNPPIKNWHAMEYPKNNGNFHVVFNGFDSDLLHLAPPGEPNAKDAGLVFGYLGTIYGPMPLRESLEGWRLARRRSPLVARSRLVFRGRIGHYATPTAQILSLLNEFADDSVSYSGPVSKTEISPVYDGFDALLLILGKSRYVTSGKVFEYAATGLPIVALHDPETAATSVLDGYPHVYPIASVTVEEIANALVAAAEHAATVSAKDVANAREWSHKLERDRQILPRITALTALIAGGAR
jgi:glycosyltransferase involved in cell wall biosynthesis